ncbi:hypothetical protein HDU76_014006 [Blyttiomyces sp. JEL0837]|nr:hypothetical protein HDU76_014006 [Blyttiomyces sp. JEL0837]
MKKRSAENELTDKNWERDDDSDAPPTGPFARASDEVLKTRRILAPKTRVGATPSGTPAKPAFAGFSFTGFQSPAAGAVSSPAADSIATKPAFGGSFSFGSTTPLPTQSTSTMPAQSQPQTSSTQPLDSEVVKFAKEMRGLNSSFLQAIQSALKDPFVDLRPQIKKYENFIADIEKKFSPNVREKKTMDDVTMSESKPNSTTPITAATSATVKPFEFKPVEVPKQPQPVKETTAPATPTFSFGVAATPTAVSTPSTSSSGFSFQPAPAVVVTTVYGSGSTSAEAKEMNRLFGLGESSGTTTSSVGSSKPPSFSFGVAATTTATATAATTKETPTTSAPATSASGFSFTQPPSFAASTGFNFKPTETKETTAAPSAQPTFGGFSFKPADTKDGTASASSSSQAPTFGGFSFGGGSSSIALGGTTGFGAFKAPSAETSIKANAGGDEEGGDEEDGVPEEQIDPATFMRGAGEETEDTLVEIKSKAFSFNAEKKNWDDVGVGMFKLNCDKNTKRSRVLMRAEGSGRVLVNAGVFKGMSPKFESDKSFSLVIVVDGKPSKYLFKVKTGAQGVVDEINKAIASFMIALFLALALIVIGVNGDDIFLQSGIYQAVRTQGCIRLLSSSGTVGCSSNLVSGVLYQIASDDDFNAFMSNNRPLEKYTVVMSYGFFYPNILRQLQGTNRLAGVVVIEEHPLYPTPAFYSPERQFPNYDQSLYAKLPTPPNLWNPNGNGLLYEDFTFPIFFMGIDPNDNSWVQSTQTIVDATKFNKDRGYNDYPLYGMELDEYMWGFKDVTTCLRRGACNIVGGKSIWSTFSPLMTRTDGKNIIIVTANIDSNSMFKGSTWGTETATTGFVTLLSVANALSQVLNSNNPNTTVPKHLVFMGFTAETFGFSGSKRFVNDLTKGYNCFDTTTCPPNSYCGVQCSFTTNFTDIDINKIEAIIEFNQVGGIGLSNPDLNPTIYVHVDDAKDAATTQLASAFFTNGTANNNVTIAPAYSNSVNLRLPPSSAMAFLAKRKIPAVVFGDYKDSYTNKYYSSELDDWRKWNQSHVNIMCGLANRASQVIYQLAGGSATVANQISANCTLVQTLMDCFTRNITCPLLTNFFTDQNTLAVSQYPEAINFQPQLNVVQFFFDRLLSNYTSWNLTSTNTTCTDSKNCTSVQVCAGGLCIPNSANWHLAFGPGLDLDSNGNFIVSDPSQATWAQSMFASTGLRARIFKATSPQYQAMQNGIGLALTIVCGGLVYLSQRWSAKWFKND